MYNTQIIVNIQNQTKIKVYYSYNQNSNFQDLLEYLAYLFPDLKICECYYFSDRYYNNIIGLEEKIDNYRYSLENLSLYRNTNKCLCDSIYLKYSKKMIFNYFKNEYDSLKEKNKKNEKEISNL